MTVAAPIIAVALAVGNIALWIFAARDYRRLRRQYEDLSERYYLGLHRYVFVCACRTLDDAEAHVQALKQRYQQ